MRPNPSRGTGAFSCSETGDDEVLEVRQEAQRQVQGLNPQPFIAAEIKKLEGVRMNHAKRRRLVKQWRDWSVKLASAHR